MLMSTIKLHVGSGGSGGTNSHGQLLRLNIALVTLGMVFALAAAAILPKLLATGGA
jgi:hypothetical protein